MNLLVHRLQLLGRLVQNRPRLSTAHAQTGREHQYYAEDATMPLTQYSRLPRTPGSVLRAGPPVQDHHTDLQYCKALRAYASRRHHHTRDFVLHAL
eukprot:418685-Rhodomonas_salina.2